MPAPHALKPIDKDRESDSSHDVIGCEKATRIRRLVELNVIEQLDILGKTHVIQDACKVGRQPMIHGWVFDLATGFLRRHTGEIYGNHAIHGVCKFHGARSGAPA